MIAERHARREDAVRAEDGSPADCAVRANERRRVDQRGRGAVVAVFLGEMLPNAAVVHSDNEMRVFGVALEVRAARVTEPDVVVEEAEEPVPGELRGDGGDVTAVPTSTEYQEGDGHNFHPVDRVSP